MAALVNANAAKVQRQRTLSPAWRDTNHALVRGGALQLQSIPHNPERQSPPRGAAAPKLPAWQQPLSTLLSSPTSVETSSHQTSTKFSSQQTSTVLSSVPQKSNSSKASVIKLRSAEGWSLDGEPVSPLRDRVANTRELSNNLKMECLERLERIDKIIPMNLRQRPSWIHKQDVEAIASIGAIGVEEEQMSDPGDLQDAFASMRRDSQLDDLQQERLAELFGAESPGTTSGYGSPGMAVLAQQRLSSRGSAIGTGGQRRRRPPWTMEDRDLTAAASVWKTTADGKPGTPSPRALPSRGRPTSRHVDAGGAKLSASHSAPVLSSPGTLVISASPALPIGTKEAQQTAEAMKGVLRHGEAPAARGLNSALRTTLRYALQV